MPSSWTKTLLLIILVWDVLVLATSNHDLEHEYVWKSI
jgi:hypothetical protein